MRFNLEEHLRREHHRTPFSTYLREIVYGGNDGIVTTFAVVAGFAGAQKDPATSAVPIISVLLFGIANLFADGLSMSLGSFLSLRADQDVFRSEKQKESYEITHEQGSEFDETVEILRRKQFTKQDATAMAKLLTKNPSYWTEFMMKDELEMLNPENENPFYVAISTFLSFIIFGVIPLIPYLLGKPEFILSVGATVTSLLILGILRSSISRQKPLRGIVETMIIGGIAAATAFFVGTFFRV